MYKVKKIQLLVLADEHLTLLAEVEEIVKPVVAIRTNEHLKMGKIQKEV